MDILIELINRFGDYGITMLLLAIIVYYFHKRTDKLETELKDERSSCDIKLESLNSELRKADKENIDILNKVTDVIENLNDNNENINRYLKSIRMMLKNKSN
jgi:hypothetical protein